MTKRNVVQKIGLNEVGRDFVVGDIHGAYDLVIAAMRQAKFDRAKDRLFAGGDLIDRGPGSHRCVKFLAQPYVQAVMGNHEAMLLELYEDGEPDEAILSVVCRYNGLSWWLNVAVEQRREILAALRKLPLALEVATRRGTVGLIHADVPKGMEWGRFLSLLEAGDPHVVKTCLEGRERLKHRDESGVAGVGRVFVGHTLQWDGVARFGNVYAIDTGAVFGLLGNKPKGHLTMARMVLQTTALAAPRQDQTQPVELKDARAELQVPFGGSMLGLA